MTSTAGQPDAAGIDSDSSSLYPPPGWVWQYPQPKKNTTHASSGMLLIVEVVHYLVYFTQVGVAWCFFHYRDVYEPQCGLFFLVIMAPIFQQIAGSFPMLMHEYEGWQIAQCEEAGCDRAEYNNDPLRYATYKLLFMFQAIGAGMYVIGVIGLERWTLGPINIGQPWTTLITMAVVLWLYIAPRKTAPLPTQFNGRSIFPIPFLILVTFIPLTIAYSAALIYLLGGWSALVPGVLVSGLYLAGGMAEGVGAEGTLNQWWHLLAVTLLNAGGGLLIVCIARHAMGLL